MSKNRFGTPILQDKEEVSTSRNRFGKMPSVIPNETTNTVQEKEPELTFAQRFAKQNNLPETTIGKPDPQFKTQQQPSMTAGEKVTTAYENKFAREDMGRLQARIDPETGKLPIKTAGDVMKNTPGESYLPFATSIPTIKDSIALYKAVKNLEAGTNTEVDDYLLAKAKAEGERDSTFGAKVVNVLTGVPSFAGELLATGGIFTAGKKVAEKAVTKGLETAAEKTARRKAIESVITRSVGNVAGATAQTVPAGFLRITAGTIQNMTPEYQYQQDEAGKFSAFISEEGDNLPLALARSFSDQWVETVSEKSGGIFNEVLSPIKNKMIKLGVFKSFLKNNPNLTSSQFMELVKASGWNGVIAEMGEERIGELMRGALTQVGLSEEGFKMPTKEQLLVELVAFSAPGAGIGLANKALQSGQDGSFKAPDITNNEQGIVPEDSANLQQEAKGVTGRSVGEAIKANDRSVRIDDSINSKVQGVIDGIEADSFTKENMQEFKDTMNSFKYIDETTNQTIKRLENIKSQIEADNFTRENIDDLITFIRKTEKGVAGEVITSTANEQAPFVPGPGYNKFAKSLESMTTNGTLLQEDLTILKILFEDTNDDYLGSLNIEDYGRLTSTFGRFTTPQRYGQYGKPVVDEGRFNEHRLQMQKGLADKGIDATRVFAHEYGHAGYYMVLNDQERAIVNGTYRRLGKQRVSQLFEGGLGGNVRHHSKNAKEFFAESFAEYVMSKKVPAKEMEPLLKRLLDKFYVSIKKLVNRRDMSAMERMRPTFEKILTGDKTTPLTEIAEKDTSNFNEELKQMFNRMDSKQPSKEVPVESLFPKQEEPFGNSPTDIAEPPEAPEKVTEIQKRTPAGKKIGIFDILRSPSEVMKKLGVYKAYRKLISSYEAYLLELPKNMDKIGAWADRIKEKDGNQRIFQWLDGNKEVQLNPEETKVANEVRAWLRVWADRLGMDEDARISDYITHIFPMDERSELPENIAAMIDGKQAKSIFNPFQLRRQGAEGYLEDTWSALEAYAKRATRKANIDPALQEFNEETAHLTEKSQLRYIEKKISNLNMRPTMVEEWIDNSLKAMFGSNISPRATLRWTTTIRKMISGAKIGGSAVTFAKNLTQGVNTLSELGGKYTLKGYKSLSLKGDKELTDNGVLRDSFYQDKKYSALKNWAHKFDKKLFINMEASEYINRGAAYWGGKLKFLDGKITPKEYKLAFGEKQPEGYKPTEEDAIQYGKYIAEKTQFLFGPLETPQIMSGPIAKTAFQFQTFALKQTELNIQRLSDKEYAKFAKYMLGSSLLFGYIGSAFGMGAGESWKTFRWGYPPIWTFLYDDLYKQGLWGEGKYGNKLDLGERASLVGKSLFTNVVPGGAQMKRSYEGFNAVNDGASRNKAGKLEYRIDETVMNYVRAILFGKYNLDEAKEYYENRDKETTSKSSTRKRF